MPSRISIAATAALAAAALAVPATASAATAKFQCAGDANANAGTTKTTNKCKGSPFGSFTAVVDTSKIPNVTYTLKLKGGTAIIAATSVLQADKVTGSWKFVKGTGKYKGISGKGRFTGALSAGTPFVFKGSVSY